MDAILIAGPTASGKSALALRLARRHGGVIVNADAMQVYRPLRILTARPTDEDMALVEHRMYGHVPGDIVYSTGRWYRDVAAALAEIRAGGRLPVVVGGTGLYFRALTGGLSEMPDVPAATRDFWRGRLGEVGPERLHAELAEVDPETAARLAPTDGLRIVRALEVFHAAGRSIRNYQTRNGIPLVDSARARRIFIAPDREILRRRIADRASVMMETGGIGEVKELLSRGLDDRYPVMKAIGVREIAALLSGKLSQDEAEDRLITQSRRYAKRQMTWFRNQLGDGWAVVEDVEKYT